MSGLKHPRIVCLLLAVSLSLFSRAAMTAAIADSPAAARIGVVATGDPIALQRAGISWYLTFGFDGSPPSNMKRASVVRLLPPPDVKTLRAAVLANKGGAWLIGNEPNVSTAATSDNLSPDEYAVLLNELETVIHDADSTALIVGPDVLNWSDSCGGCDGGYTLGFDWTQQFYNAYQSRYGTRPPIDRWAIHTYELDWQHTPNLHTDFHVRQLTALRQWLDSMPAEAGRSIWDSELGFHWGFHGWKFDDQHKLVPASSYDDAGAQSWLQSMLDWLMSDGAGLGIERSFLYGQAPAEEGFSEAYGGLALFSDGSPDSDLSETGKVLSAFMTSYADSADSAASTGSADSSR
jgi:hypothetical protein